MGHERWFRGQHDGQGRPFDWQTAARQQGIPENLARTLYERAMQQAHGATPARVRDIYLALLADARRETARPSPGKVTRTMRLQAERVGQRRARSPISPLTGQATAPGKASLTSYLDPAHRPAHDRRSGTRVREELVRLARATPQAFPEPEETDIGEAMRLYEASLAVAMGDLDSLDARDRELLADEYGIEVDDEADEDTAAPPLPETAQTSTERAPGQRYDDVEVHRDRQAGTGDMHAFTRGRAIRRLAGAFAPGTRRSATGWRDAAPQPAGTWAAAGLPRAVALDRVPGAHPAELEQEIVQHVLAGLAARAGQPLPPVLAQRLARLLGHDFGHVRVHTDERAAEAAALLGARAFTMGAHVYMGAGQWQPGQASFERLLVHELTHVVQHDQGRLAPGPAGRVRVAAPGEASEREAEAAAALALTPDVSPISIPRGDEAAAPGARAAAPGQGGVASPDLLPSLSDIVRMVSPELATLLDEGPMGMIQELLEGGIGTFLAPFTSTIESIGGTIDGLVDSFGEVLGFIDGLFAGDPGCCQAFIDGIDRIRSIARGIAENPAVQALQEGLGQVTGAIQEIAVLVLSPVFDVVKDLLGGAWEGISSLAGTIAGWLEPVLDVSRAAFDWVMEQLGIGGGGEGGILDWLTGVAGEAWNAIAETLGPVAGPLQTVAGVLLALSPVGPLMLVIQYGPDLVQAVLWLWQNRNDPDVIERAHAEMGHTILPGLLDATQGFGQAMQSAATWLVEQATGLSTGLLELAGTLTGVPLLGLVQGAVQSFSEGATRFAQWATGALSTAVQGLQEGFADLRDFVAPYADVLCSVGMAIVNPGMIPMILAGHAWMALPDCIKGPIIDLLLDAAIEVLDALPALPLFGPLWAILRSGVLGFLRGLRAQPTEVKEQVSNKLARIISGSSPAFLLGFVEGFLTGVWEGLTDPFVLIWSAVEGLGSLVSWFRDMATQAMSASAPASAPAASAEAPAGAQDAAGPAPAQDAGLPTRGELGERVGQMGAELGPPVEQVTGGFWPAVQSLFQGGEGLTLEGLIARLGDVWAAIDQSIQGAAASLAGRVCEFFMGDQAEGELGKAVGWLAGTIAFEVLLGILTAGAWQPVSAAGKALKAFARILDWTGEALGAAFRLLGRIGGLLVDALQGLRRMLASAGGAVRVVLDALGEIGQKLLAFADELLGRFGRGVAGEGAEEAAERGARRTAAETTEEAAEETAERGVRETAEETAEEAAEETAERGARETAEETTEEAAEETAEQGGKRADDTPDMTEKLRVAGLARVAAETMQAAGVPALAIVHSLKSTFQPRYRWIRDFRAEPLGPLSHVIWLIASKIEVTRVQVPYQKGAKELTVAPDGTILLDGRKIGANKLEEVYKQLGLTHAIRGHGPGKNIIDVVNEAMTNAPSFASGRFGRDADVIRAFSEAQAQFHRTGDLVIELSADASVGRAFIRRDKLPSGVTPIDELPFENLPDVVEVAVTRSRAVFNPDGSIKTIYPL